MPLNGGGTASRVPGTTAVPNTTISSSNYNSELDDVYNILNTARPIAYGGTGATTADGAATSLGVVRFGGAQSLTEPEKEQARDNIGAIASSTSVKRHLYGLGLSNNTGDATNDIDIAVGEAASDGATPFLMPLLSVLTKRLDAAWAVGTGNGGLDTGSIANTTYHLWLIQRSDTGVVDALFSASATAPTLPANYDRKRRIGSIIRTSGAILPFKQSGNVFRISPVLTLSTITAIAGGLGAVTNVPTGIVVDALIYADMATNGAGASVIVQFGSAFSSGLTTGNDMRGSMYSASGGASTATSITPVRTDTSGQVYRSVAVSGAINVNVYISGWIDIALPANNI